MSNPYLRYGFLSATLCLTCGFTELPAQNLGSIVGLVTDASGGVIPGAAVRVTQEETNVSHTLQTDITGTFLAAALNSGMYTIEVSATGFKAYRRSGIVLNLRDQIRLDVQLEIGSITETVEVTGQAVAL